MRRACSSDVRWVSFLRIGTIQCSRAAEASGVRYSRAARARRQRRAERALRPALRRATRSRISDDAMSSWSIGNSSTRSGCRACRAPIGGDRGSVPGRIATPIRASSRTRSGCFQVGTRRTRPPRSGRADRRNPRASSESTVRPCGSSATSAWSIGWKASSVSRSRTAAGVATALWPGCSTTRTSSLSRSNRAIAPRARARWPLCGGSNAPPRMPVPPRSLPVEHLVPDLDLGARLDPGGAKRLLELLPLGRSADDAEARVRAEHAKFPLRREGADSRGSRAPRATAVSTGSGTGGQSANSARLSSSIPWPVAQEIRWTATMRSSTTPNGAGVRQQVGLVQHDHLRPLAEPRPVRGQLLVDHAEPLVGVLLGGVDHVQEQAGALEMRRETRAPARSPRSHPRSAPGRRRS